MRAQNAPSRRRFTVEQSSSGSAAAHGARRAGGVVNKRCRYAAQQRHACCYPEGMPVRGERRCSMRNADDRGYKARSVLCVSAKCKIAERPAVQFRGRYTFTRQAAMSRIRQPRVGSRRRWSRRGRVVVQPPAGNVKAPRSNETADYVRVRCAGLSEREQRCRNCTGNVLFRRLHPPAR